MAFVSRISTAAMIAVAANAAHSSVVYEFEFKAVLTEAVFSNAYYINDDLDPWDENYEILLGRYEPHGEFTNNGNFIDRSSTTHVGASYDGYIRATLDHDLFLESIDCVIGDFNCQSWLSFRDYAYTGERMPSLGTFEAFYIDYPYSSGVLLTIGKDGGYLESGEDWIFTASDEKYSFYYHGSNLYFSVVDIVQRQPLPGCEPSGFQPPKCDVSVVPLPAALPLMATAAGPFAALMLARTRRRRQQA